MTKTMTTISIDESVFRRFKSACVLWDMSISQSIEMLMIAKLNKEQK